MDTLTVANMGAGEMIQGFKTLAALPENQSSVPSIPSDSSQLPIAPVPGDPMPLASDKQTHAYI